MRNLNIAIVFQDSDLVIVDKPSGLLSVPGRGPDKQDCVVNRLKRLLPDTMAQPAVHRLDMFTSGLMILAVHPEAHRHLSIQFAHREVEKTYIALVQGHIREAGGDIRLAFRLDPDNRPHQVYDPVRGKPGVTRWRQLGIEGAYTRIEFQPLTGRTHQLRLHAAHPSGLDAPIVGDRLYGSGKEGDRMCLHAHQLKFRHPKTGGTVDIRSDVPF